MFEIQTEQFARSQGDVLRVRRLTNVYLETRVKLRASVIPLIYSARERRVKRMKRKKSTICRHIIKRKKNRSNLTTTRSHFAPFITHSFVIRVFIIKKKRSFNVGLYDYNKLDSVARANSFKVLSYGV